MHGQTNTHFPAAQADLSIQALLLDVDRFASHDGPGIRTTVFLKGCPLSCVWCHSPESRLNRPELLYQNERCSGCGLCIEACPQHALSLELHGDQEVAVLDRSQCDACGLCAEQCYDGALKLAGTTVTVGEMVEQVARDLPYFRNSGGGVTLSGGEPARQARFAYHFLLACQERGIHTALETTGYAHWSALSALAQVTDLFLFDIKFMHPEDHRRYTGVPNAVIHENLARLVEQGSQIHVRVPCIAGINDSPEQIRAVASFVAGLGLSQIVLLPYNGAAGAKYEWIGRDFDLSALEPQSPETMANLAGICEEYGLCVQIGG